MSSRAYTSASSIHRQGGAALIVAMILLLVLTLLAVSGMNTSSTELTMAGNEQYRAKAFQAAETGIEQALLNGAFNPSIATETLPASPQRVNESNTFDTYQAVITPQPGVNQPQQAMWGNSWNSFSTFHFEIESTGRLWPNNAARAASPNRPRAMSTHTQGMFVLSPYDPGTPPPLPGVSGLTPP